MDASLVREINSNQALLEHQAPGLGDKLAELRQAGNLDRKTKRDIEASLRQAHSILSELRLAVQSGPLGAWQARNIAQELNAQADNLDATLDEWQKNLSAADERARPAEGGPDKVLQEQQALIQTLSDISRMLHDTGRAIVDQAR